MVVDHPSFSAPQMVDVCHPLMDLGAMTGNNTAS